MADLGRFQRFPLKPPFAATLYIKLLEHAYCRFRAREHALALANNKYLQTPSTIYAAIIGLHLHVNSTITETGQG